MRGSVQTRAERAPSRRVVSRSFKAMGSLLTLSFYTDDEERAGAAAKAVQREFERLQLLLTVWRPDSDVSKINRAAGGPPVQVSKETIEVVKAALEFGRRTNGKFDITFGALSGLWKFDHDKDDEIPDPAEVKKRVALVDYAAVEVDEKAGTIRLARAGMRMHLGGIGKGYAVDRGVAMLRELGFRDFMIQAGGDLYVAGKKGDTPWRVGVRDPRGPPSDYFAATEVTDRTFSTSGDYERFFVRDGRRFHHIIDPDTGEPAQSARSVTVMAESAMTADALSTGIFLLGPERGLALVEAMPGVEVLIVGTDNEVHASSGLGPVLKILHPPTDGV